jgi:nucleoside-diphosphate-sugar epimerase
MAGDYRDPEVAKRALTGVSRVVHLAVSHGNSLSAYIRADSDPTIAFARQCLEQGVQRFVYTGTIDSLPLDRRAALLEADGVDPRITRRNNYAHSKAITERRLHELRDQAGLPLVVVRPAIVIGEGGPLEHMGVANWNGLGRCVYWGDGSNPLPFVLVEDVVAGIIAAAETPGIEGRSYNLSAESVLSARDYVEAINTSAGIKVHATTSSAAVSFLGDLLKWSAKLLVRHPDARRVPSLHDWRCRQQLASFNTSSARTDLGWRPESNRDTLIERGISLPARLARDL